MDELYRGYRIAIRKTGHWIARITHVRGTRAPVVAESSLEEGPGLCVQRARIALDRYLAFLEQPDDRERPER